MWLHNWESHKAVFVCYLGSEIQRYTCPGTKEISTEKVIWNTTIGNIDSPESSYHKEKNIFLFLYLYEIINFN